MAEATPPQDFTDWLASLNLLPYLDQAREWWIENGAIDLSEVLENWQDFADDLGLKPLERKRIEKHVGNALRPMQTRGKLSKLSQEIMDWMQELHLAHHSEALLEWSEENGASSMDEIRANWRSFVEKMDLKPLERTRLEKDLRTRTGKATQPQTTAGSSIPALQVAKSSVQDFQPAMPTRPSEKCFGPPENPLLYTLLEEIGFGVTSKVYKCKRGQEIFAVKAISLKKLRHQPGFSRVSDRLHQEIEILLSLKHERVVKLVDVVEEFDYLYLIMELVSGGELGEWIVKKGSFPENMARHVFVQLVEGLSYIHSKGIIHRDLKPDNVLVDEGASKLEHLEVKLSDFGHSRLINDGFNTRHTARVGTAMYWAPEVCDPEKAALGYDQSVDLWSLGVVLYVMLIGFFPFDSGDHRGSRMQESLDNMTFQRRTSGPELSSAAQDLIRSLLVVNPQQRLSLKCCLSHVWTTSGAKLDSMLGFMKLETDPRNPTAVEVHVPLPVKPNPEELQELRKELQQWMIKFRRFAAIRQGEVIANLGDSAEAGLSGNKDARQQLQAIVDRRCGRGMILVNDQKMWNAIAESKNEKMHCPLTPLVSSPRLLEPRKDGSKASTPSPRHGSGQAHKLQDKRILEEGRASNTGKHGKDGKAGYSRWPAETGKGQAKPSQPSPEAEGARFVVSALQGHWESQRDSSETYVVHGLDVVRHQRQRSGVQRRPFSLRWNVTKQCLEWGSGKYFLQPPTSLPMDEAVWLASAGGPGFAWRRVPGKGGPGTSQTRAVVKGAGKSWEAAEANPDEENDVVLRY
ncbi:fhkD [Symbiodinium sp. CCMP2456]|nr:fhkD [Symbiodinium sp. CCMP2456]